MPLTALEIKKLTCPEGQAQTKISDGNGLFLLVKSSGSKLWRFRYRYAGKHQELAFGKYPTIPLADARTMAVKARAMLVEGINPASARREAKDATVSSAQKFSKIALLWWDQQADSWTQLHGKKVKRWIEQDMQELGKLPVDQIDQGHLTDMVLSMEAKGHARSASTVMSVVNRIFGYALANRLTRTNPAQGFPLSDITKPLPKVKHRAAITNPKQLAKLIRDIDDLDSGTFCTIEALRLIPRLFLRPSEVRGLKWDYVDFEQQILRIPGEEMKKDREHLVPLATQVIKQLSKIKEVTGYSAYIFPSLRNSDRPISKNVMTNRLRFMGYGADEMTAHGFRSTASTLLHEQGWSHDVIEAQLAHLTGSETSRAYNRSIYINERKRIMQSWADYLDALRDGADVVPIGVNYG
jgi:integrase